MKKKKKGTREKRVPPSSVSPLYNIIRWKIPITGIFFLPFDNLLGRDTSVGSALALDDETLHVAVDALTCQVVILRAGDRSEGDRSRNAGCRVDEVATDDDILETVILVVDFCCRIAA